MARSDRISKEDRLPGFETDPWILSFPLSGYSDIDQLFLHRTVRDITFLENTRELDAQEYLFPLPSAAYHIERAQRRLDVSIRFKNFEIIRSTGRK